ncbi:hypothetical protein H9I49_07015, partial [Terrabacter sp. MAHUQ-38]|nr:hypothetical protein [Terrabacter sp. MAHUQ-38]
MPFLDARRSPFEFVLEMPFRRAAGGSCGHAVPVAARASEGPERLERSGLGVSVAGSDDDVGLRDAALDAASDRVLGQIEWLEVAKARLEGRLVDAYAALHTIEEQQLARL